MPRRLMRARSLSPEIVCDCAISLASNRYSGHIYAVSQEAQERDAVSGDIRGGASDHDRVKDHDLLLALVAAVPALADERPAQPPYSCRLLYDEQKKCAFGSCKRVVERLRNECLRDGGRP